MKRARRCPAYTWALWLACAWFVRRPDSAHAELSALASAGLGAMVSDDQRARLGFDRVALVGDAHLAQSLVRWLSLRAGARYGAFLADGPPKAGQVLVPELGLELGKALRGARLFLALDAGAAFTGELVRPAVHAALGADFRASTWLRLGPIAGYGRVVQWNDPGLSGDAGYLWLGVTMRGELWKRTAPAAPKRRPPAPPRPPPPPVSTISEDELLTLIEQAVPMRVDRTELLAPVLFELDKAELTATGTAMLHEVAHTLAERTDLALIRVEGYADARGDAAYNRALSLRRAEAVRSFLIAHGVAEDRLVLAGEGEERPVEAGETDADHTQNRRVVFRVLRARTP